jgi:hypothetical protein
LKCARAIGDRRHPDWGTALPPSSSAPNTPSVSAECTTARPSRIGTRASRRDVPRPAGSRLWAVVGASDRWKQLQGSAPGPREGFAPSVVPGEAADGAPGRGGERRWRATQLKRGPRVTLARRPGRGAAGEGGGGAVVVGGCGGPGAAQQRDWRAGRTRANRGRSIGPPPQRARGAVAEAEGGGRERRAAVPRHSA